MNHKFIQTISQERIAKLAWYIQEIKEYSDVSFQINLTEKSIEHYKDCTIEIIMEYECN